VKSSKGKAGGEVRKYRERVYRIVRRIPHGRVMTYGQIAAMLGEGYTPRTVGYAMHAADAENVPWQRVINSQGKCSTGRLTIPINLQQQMLEQEGIVFDEKGRCDLKKYLYGRTGPVAPKPRAEKAKRP
jgi:methylated-DNA-protein-cysteine methyltransferase related protein